MADLRCDICKQISGPPLSLVDNYCDHSEISKLRTENASLLQQIKDKDEALVKLQEQLEITKSWEASFCDQVNRLTKCNRDLEQEIEEVRQLARVCADKNIKLEFEIRKARLG